MDFIYLGLVVMLTALMLAIINGCARLMQRGKNAERISDLSRHST